jgi:hypothetical protein
MNIDHYRRQLPVRKHRLDEDLEIQGQYMDEIAQNVTRTSMRAAELKDALGVVEADVARDLREDFPKMAVAVVSGEVTRSQKRRQALTAYLQAKSEHENWAHLLEAWKQKGYSIKVMADLYSSQYFTASSTTNSFEPRRLPPNPRARESVATTVEARLTARRKLNDS